MMFLQASAPAAQPDPAPASGGALNAVSTITAMHFALIALLALLVIAGIVYGARLKSRRKAAERHEQQRMDELGGAPADPAQPDALLSPPVGLDREARPPQAGGPAAGPVSQLKGLGPKVTARLAELGVTQVGQIAALTDDEAEALDARLGPFQGRLTRDRWIEQARFLAAGDKAGFEAVFGRL